jgi:hypothetical protein
MIPLWPHLEAFGGAINSVIESAKKCIQIHPSSPVALVKMPLFVKMVSLKSLIFFLNLHCSFAVQQIEKDIISTLLQARHHIPLESRQF